MTPSRAFSASDIPPIPSSAIEQYRPSWTITSVIGTSPIRLPGRSRIACGARVIESKPPASTVVASPARIIAAAIATALMLARHTSLSVIPGTSRLTPPSSAARRPGFCPFAACSTFPTAT